MLNAKDSTGLPRCKVRVLTSGPKHHFFGYYGICPWNQSGKYLFSLESPFQDHFPTQDESAAIGLVDARTGKFETIAETHAWNLQQGTMLHWNPLARIFHGYSIMVGRDAGSTNFVSKPFESDTFAANSADGPLSPIPKTGFSGIIAIP
jgi:hypothetical protein